MNEDMRPVTISGYSGSGKSYMSKLVSGELGLDYFCAGEIFRRIAEESNSELIRYVARAPEEVDDFVNQEILKAYKEGNVIIDSRLGAFLCPEAIKIWLKCSEEETARRVVYRDSLKGIETPMEVALNNVRERNKRSRERLKKRYGFDLDDLSIYDLVLDNEELSVKDTLSILLHFIRVLNAE